MSDVIRRERGVGWVLEIDKCSNIITLIINSCKELADILGS